MLKHFTVTTLRLYLNKQVIRRFSLLLQLGNTHKCDTEAYLFLLVYSFD